MRWRHIGRPLKVGGPVFGEPDGRALGVRGGTVEAGQQPPEQLAVALGENFGAERVRVDPGRSAICLGQDAEVCCRKGSHAVILSEYFPTNQVGKSSYGGFFSNADNLGMRDWSETDFQARVDARIEQLGKTETTLLRAAGLTGDEIRKVPKRARRIDTLYGIARALQWTIGQALGVQDPTLFLDREREVDPTKLKVALSLAEDAVGDNPSGDRVGVIADAASLVYSVLSERESSGLPIDDDEARALISSVLRRLFTK